MKTDRSSEDFVFSAVALGIIEIDEQGRCWRNNPRRRAESPSNKGYLQLRFSRNGRKGVAQAHRIVYRYFKGDIPAGLTINHLGSDGDVTNNRPENLEPATYSEQIRHAKDVLGRAYKDHRGEGNNMVKLRADQVQQIRERRRAGERLTDIARDFGIVFQTVSRIARGGLWRSLPDQQPEAV